jgi:hypothetical protein
VARKWLDKWVHAHIMCLSSFCRVARDCRVVFPRLSDVRIEKDVAVIHDFPIIQQRYRLQTSRTALVFDFGEFSGDGRHTHTHTHTHMGVQIRPCTTVLVLGVTVLAGWRALSHSNFKMACNTIAQEHGFQDNSPPSYRTCRIVPRTRT